MLKRIARQAARRIYRALRHRPEHDLLAALPPDEHERRFREDRESLRVWIDGIERVTGEAKGEPELFRPSSKALGAYEGRARLWRRWQAFLDYAIALDSIKNFHGGFARFEPDSRENARSFLLAYAAFLAQYANGYRWIRRVGRSRLAATLLDEPVPEFGLDGGLFDRLKWNVLHLASLAKVRAGRAYLAHVRPRLGDAGGLLDYLGRADREVRRALGARAVRDFAANALAILKSKAFAVWFPVQRGLSLAIGHAVVRSPEPLVTQAQLDGLRPRLEPGDIFLVRRSWKLSNIGLPGFWPHAALYVGTPRAMRERLRDDDVRAFCREHSAGVEDFVELLQVKYPGKWREFVARPNEVVEAVSSAVTFHTLEQACQADHVAVMRPRVPKRAIARAILLAFHYHGRKYDFNFDFYTDHELVCSEVVYKAYEGAVPLPLVSVAGRMTLPPNEIAAHFERQLAAPDRALDFVDFLDGGRHGSAAEFCASHRRPKWEFVTRG